VTVHLLQGKSLEWLLESVADAAIIFDQAGRIVFANPPVERLFGYPCRELAGKSIEALLPEHFRRTHHDRISNYFAKPSARALSTGIELLGLRQDGSEFPMDVSLSPLRIEQELLTLAMLHDTTPRKQAEDALRESEARMRAIFYTAVDGIVTIDESGLIQRFNPAAERLFGYVETEVIGKNVSMLMPAPYQEAHDGYLARYLQTGEKQIIGIGREVVGQRKDGTTFPMDLAVSEMRQGKRRMFTGTVRDISERKQAEEQRDRLLQELESANEELKNFAYVVSHDLKAPLRAISSLADWLATDYADKLDDEGKEHLRLLTNRVRRMDGLIDGILQYSRVGRVKEAVVAVNLDRVVREVLDSLAPPASITVSIDNPLPTIMSEPTRIQQVFQNLLSNAIKYMDKPAGEIHVACNAEGRQWKFSISDNGPGIKQQHFEKIFQLFQTLAPRDRVESSGVGLALVKKIVEMYGGQIQVDSTVGTGSTFSFTLPRASTTSISTKGTQA
jgi:two-component system, LuxR family, sensor kinase FixL